jgi:hypothetical protein
VVQWIAEGRANARTLARTDSNPQRLPLEQFPEFAAALLAKSQPVTPPTAPPVVEPVRGDPNLVTATALASTPQLDIGHCLSRAWTLMLSDFWPILGYSTVVLLLMGAANYLYVGLVINGPLLGGLMAYYLRRIRSQPGDWENIFSGFRGSFLSLFLAVLISSLLTGLGAVCCLLPGIYLLIAWQFTLFLVIDKRLEFWDAMEAGRKVVHQCWWQVFGLVILNFLIGIAGGMVLCVGAFVAAPVTFLALTYAYEDLFNPQPAASH